VLADAIVETSNALGAGFVPRRTSIHADSNYRLDADLLDHSVHQGGLPEDAVEDRPAIAKVAHVWLSSFALHK
jgi:hypothetical protein